MAMNQLVDRVRFHFQRWLGRPTPLAQAPVAAAPPKRTMADVELPPVIALSKGKRYHAPDCGFVQTSRGQVLPFRSRTEAHDHGLEPCQVCQPSNN